MWCGCACEQRFLFHLVTTISYTQIQDIVTSYRAKRNHQFDVMSTVLRHFSLEWNVLDLVVIGVSASYLVLKPITTYSASACSFLRSRPRDILAINCILITLRTLHGFLAHKQFGPIMAAILLILPKVTTEDILFPPPPPAQQYFVDLQIPLLIATNSIYRSSHSLLFGLSSRSALQGLSTFSLGTTRCGPSFEHHRTN